MAGPSFSSLSVPGTSSPVPRGASPSPKISDLPPPSAGRGCKCPFGACFQNTNRGPIVIVFIVPACLIVLKLRVGEPLGQYLIPSLLNNLGTAVMLLKGHRRRGKDRIEPFDFHLHHFIRRNLLQVIRMENSPAQQISELPTYRVHIIAHTGFTVLNSIGFTEQFTCTGEQILPFLILPCEAKCRNIPMALHRRGLLPECPAGSNEKGGIAIRSTSLLRFEQTTDKLSGSVFHFCAESKIGKTAGFLL